MGLREEHVVREVPLPDGRDIAVRIGVPREDYLDPEQLDTVTIELRDGDDVLAVLDTLLEHDQVAEANALADAVARGLASGQLEPTASAIEPLVDSVI